MPTYVYPAMGLVPNDTGGVATGVTTIYPAMGLFPDDIPVVPPVPPTPSPTPTPTPTPTPVVARGIIHQSKIGIHGGISIGAVCLAILNEFR